MFFSIVMIVVLAMLWRGLFCLRIGRRSRWVLGAVLSWFVLYYPIVSYFWGSLASPEIPRIALIIFSIGFMAMLFWVATLLLKDVIALLLWAMAKITRKPGRMATALARNQPLLWGSLSVATMLAVIGVWQAIKVPDVRRIEIAIADLPQSFDGYRIVHLTDLHVSRLLPGHWLAQVVAKTNALTADAVMISGDLVDGLVHARANDYPPFADLRARDGVFAVVGNHEYYSGYLEWLNVFAKAGITMLINTHHLIERDGAHIAVAGVADPAASRIGQPLPDINAAMAGIAAQTVTVLIDHRPGRFVENQARGVDLQLSGHTHGGHLYGFDRVVAYANNGFVSGHYRHGHAQMYLSNGAGLWPGFAIRLGPRSEITEITLRRAP